MKNFGVFLLVAVAIGLFAASLAFPNPKPISAYIQDLNSSDLQVQAIASAQIISAPDTVPTVSLERGIIVAGQQYLSDTKQPLTDILQNASYRGTTRGIAADSLGLIARSDPLSIEALEIFDLLISASYDKSSAVRFAACRALGNTGNIEAIVRLNDLYIVDPDPRVKYVAGEAYYKLIGSPPGGQPAERSTSSASGQTVPLSDTPTLESLYQRILGYITIHLGIQE